MALLHRSFERFRESSGAAEREAFQAFTEAHAAWLDDFALFMALKQAHDGKPWHTWEPAIRNREPTAMTHWAARLTDTVQEHQYLQYQFFSQWAALKTYANQRNIKIIGDVPIFVAYDSADVWANPALSASTRTATRSRRQVCRQTTSARPVSCGAIRSTAGT